MLRRFIRPAPRAALRFGAALFASVALTLYAGASLRITSVDADGDMTWTNAPVPGVCTIEAAATPEGPWVPMNNVFSTTSSGQTRLPALVGNRFHRLSAVSVAPTAAGFSNLVAAYGLLETIAGDGVGRTDNVSYWQAWFEGGMGTAASLSRPHFAMADRAGRVYIADKNSHAILRLEPNGTIHTHAGTHVAGFNGEGPAPATSLQLDAPNGLWVREDGTVYVLDTANRRVRRVSPDGVMTTLFAAPNADRGLWVRPDEGVAYFGATTRIRSWTPAGGVVNFVSGFSQLGLFSVEPNGGLVVCDRGAHYVYRVSPTGVRTVLAGNGTTSGGGHGSLATQTGLNGPRGVWAVPTGGYLILLHDGAQLWYLDTSSILRLLVNGLGGNTYTHDGDGQYFYAPDQLRIGEGRSVTMDYEGNILMVESDYGFVRRIRFQRMEAWD